MNCYLARVCQPTYLYGVHVVRNDHQSSLLLLNKTGDVVDPVLEGDGLLPRSALCSLTLLLGSAAKTLLLHSLGLWAVLMEQLE